MVENGVLFYETGKHIRRDVLFVVYIHALYGMIV